MHLSDFVALLKKVTRADVEGAAAEMDQGRRDGFQSAKNWLVVVSGKVYAHRPLIAFSVARHHQGQSLASPDFDISRDNECKKVLKGMEFDIIPIGADETNE